MSVSLQRAVLNLRFPDGGPPPLPQSARHVLLVIASHCNEKRNDRSSFVSINTIAAETGARAPGG